MPDITIPDELWERLKEFNPVEASIIKKETEMDYTVPQAVLTIGLDLMMDQFFRQLDDGTLRRSVEQFYQRYPNSQKAEPSKLSDTKLVCGQLALVNPSPNQSFT